MVYAVTANSVPNNMNKLLVELKQVNVRLREQIILDNINLSVYAGQILTIIGPNGAGKTTLLRTLLGLVKLTSGSIFKKQDLSIGYVPQKLQLNPSLPLTVERFLKLLPHISDQQIATALAEVSASHILKRSMQSISGGELQRVLLARALLRRPQLLVLDEPTQGVDINGQVELYRLINQICEHYGCGVLMVSHDLNLVMANTDQVICLNKHICCSGYPEHVSNDPAFKELFGVNANSFAIYHHRHDHQHDLHGAVVKTSHQCGDDCKHV